MDTSLKNRFLWGLCLAVLFLFIAAGAQAQEITVPASTGDDCQECHAEVVEQWEEGGHAHAASPAFKEAWQAAGEPEECLPCHTTGFEAETGTYAAEGVGCEHCHWVDSNAPSHPAMVMETDMSSSACGECHLDTHKDWESSVHGQGELDCVRCHDPHEASIKGEDVQSLCYNCHPSESHFFDFTAHAEENLLCTDCHLQVSDAPMGEGHARRVHTFEVNLETCSECHADQMHMPSPDTITTTLTTQGQPPSQSQIVATVNETGDTALCEVVPSSADTGSGTLLLSQLPLPSGPLNLLIASVAGLVIGLFVAPFAERLYQRVVVTSEVQ